jgi:hypothetical protein
VRMLCVRSEEVHGYCESTELRSSAGCLRRTTSNAHTKILILYNDNNDCKKPLRRSLGSCYSFYSLFRMAFASITRLARNREHVTSQGSGILFQS